MKEKLYQLEEQLKETELRRISDVKEEEKRNKECLFKLEQTKNEEIDELLATQYDLEAENAKMKSQVSQAHKMLESVNSKSAKLEENMAQEVSFSKIIKIRLDIQTKNSN